MAKEKKPKKCPTCDGKGYIEIKKERHFDSIRVCHTCDGKGVV